MKDSRTPSSPSRRPAAQIWVLLLVWLAALGMPCVHCTLAAFERGGLDQAGLGHGKMDQGEAQVASVAPEAHCPMHAAAAPAPPAPSSATECQSSSRELGNKSCCCSASGAPGASPRAAEILPSPAPALVAATLPSREEPLPSRLVLPPEDGGSRSHAPPAFKLPLRI